MTAGSGVPMAAKRSTKSKRATNSRQSRAHRMTQQSLAGTEFVEPADPAITDAPSARLSQCCQIEGWPVICEARRPLLLAQGQLTNPFRCRVARPTRLVFAPAPADISGQRRRPTLYQSLDNCPR